MQTRSLTDRRGGNLCVHGGGGNVEGGVELVVDVKCVMHNVSVIAL